MKINMAFYICKTVLQAVLLEFDTIYKYNIWPTRELWEKWSCMVIKTNGDALGTLTKLVGRFKLFCRQNSEFEYSPIELYRYVALRYLKPIIKICFF